MRAICNVCGREDKCKFIKNGREKNCVNIKISDYGYEEAIQRFKDRLIEMQGEYITLDLVFDLTKELEQ